MSTNSLTAVNNTKERIYKFDNVKFLAILLVVVGHFIEGYTDKSDMFKSLFVFIYSFHMPLFIFLSGLFQKRFSNENKLRVNKIAYLVVLGFILKFLSYFSKYLSNKDTELNLLGGSSIEWFLFVLAMFAVAAYVLRNVHPAIVISVSFILGCVCGYFDFIGDTLYLSRFFVYLPCYFIGYYLTPQKVMDFTSKTYVKVISCSFALVYFVLSFRYVQQVYKLRKLFTGRNPFSAVPIEGCSCLHRLLCYAIALLMCLAVMCIVPNIKIPFISHMGQNTLGVYFWHNILLHLLRATPFFGMVLATGDPLYKVLLLVIPVIVCVVLSCDIFSYPLNKLNVLINKLSSKWCYTLVILPLLIAAVITILV